VSHWRDAGPGEFAVIGDPVSHSLSPKMQNAALHHLGRGERYSAVHVPVGEVLPALDHLAALGYLGVNVTVPHKEAVIPWLNTIDPFAERANAVNTINLQTKSGINTDAPGFIEVLTDAGLPEGSSILLLGAGGSARALALALTSASFKLSIWNRTPERAAALAESVGGTHTSGLDLKGFDAVINTTSASLQGEAIPVLWDAFEGVAVDLMYQEGLTPFLLEAANQGLRAIDGRNLLVAQGALSLEFWLGVTAPRDVMMEAIG